MTDRDELTHLSERIRTAAESLPIARENKRMVLATHYLDHHWS